MLTGKWQVKSILTGIVLWNVTLLCLMAHAGGVPDLASEVKLSSGTTSKTVTISTVRTIKSDLMIPSNIGLKFTMGGMIDVQKDATLTIAGPIDSPLTQIFRGDGKVIFGKGQVEKVYPQWWGARTDDDGDDTAAIQAAIDSLSSKLPWLSQSIAPNAGIVFFPGGRYNISARLGIRDGITLEGTPNRTEIHAVKPVPAIIQRADSTPPAPGTHFNPATRVTGIRIAHLLLHGGKRDEVTIIEIEGIMTPLTVGSDIGLDLTNVGYSTIDHVSIVNCKVGILMAEHCTYNTLINTVSAHCITGLEAHILTLNNNIFGGRIQAVITGLLIHNAGQLNLYGVTFDANKSVAVDIRAGSGINIQNPWFDLVPPAVPVRIAPGVASCSLINPYLAGATPKVIENHSDSTLILDAASDRESFGSQLLRAKSLQTSGITQTNKKAMNLRGKIVISDRESSAMVTFPVAEPDGDYFLTATCVSMTGSPPADARHAYIKGKTKNGFEICLDRAPGPGNSVTVDWILVR